MDETLFIIQVLDTTDQLVSKCICNSDTLINLMLHLDNKKFKIVDVFTVTGITDYKNFITKQTMEMGEQ